MKPVSRKARNASIFFQKVEIGKVIGKVQGSVKKLSAKYQNATVVLYSKANLPRLQRLQACHDRKQRRFTGAIRTYQSNHL